MTSTSPVGMPVNSLASPSTTSATSPHDAMGRDAFLQLLVAQLRHQDPLNPLQGAEFIAQTAQFTMVERMEQMSVQNSEALSMQRSMTGAALIGSQVTWLDDRGVPHEGVVSSVRFDPRGPLLSIDGQQIPLTAVMGITALQNAHPTTTPSTTAP
jgi:flagellar basal-body rod modification protein FlgD